MVLPLNTNDEGGSLKSPRALLPERIEYVFGDRPGMNSASKI
jgi:hypothetical protein